jgi:glycine betaine/proline transport system ATP-binding protein
MREEGLSSIYVVDGHRNLKGYVTADDASDARKKDIKDLNEILRTDVPKVPLDKPMQEIIEIIYDTPVPIAVVDGEKLKGIIIRGSFLAALAGEGEVKSNV